MEKDQVIYYQLNSPDRASSYKGFQLILETEGVSSNLTVHAVSADQKLKVKSDDLWECVTEIMREIDLIK
ncbi:MAG TPA: hypothetical protein DCL80_15415 [Balneola sp.]|nr:hypothetical protein [Balneola sp.]MAO78912.1 hypothetical protein [Balneola sp.]MBF63571.1 hypothetical protein [Balneola sp.]HAH52562.1 hypothetical protein [Balneola sp.]HAW81392.1 hypothetical protein [Balneola sp.]|tara:strand:- start:3934 stop:4143 length:210 start_codon:yes stop_codon:yes gene_type:complete